VKSLKQEPLGRKLQHQHQYAGSRTDGPGLAQGRRSRAPGRRRAATHPGQTPTNVPGNNGSTTLADAGEARAHARAALSAQSRLTEFTARHRVRRAAIRLILNRAARRGDAARPHLTAAGAAQPGTKTTIADDSWPPSSGARNARHQRPASFQRAGWYPRRKPGPPPCPRLKRGGAQWSSSDETPPPAPARRRKMLYPGHGVIPGRRGESGKGPRRDAIPWSRAVPTLVGRPPGRRMLAGTRCGTGSASTAPNLDFYGYRRSSEQQSSALGPGCRGWCVTMTAATELSNPPPSSGTPAGDANRLLRWGPRPTPRCGQTGRW